MRTGGPYDPILTGVGLLGADGKLTKEARTKYVLEVLGLLATGNADGKGGTPMTKIFNSLIPLPPVPGPEIFNITTLKSEKLFWFDPDPIATLMAATLVDEKACPAWHMIFPDLLYAKTAEALNAKGATPLFPLFDVSVAFPDIEGFPIPLPDLAIKANLKPPKLLIKLKDFIPALPEIPIPPIPPKLPDFGFGLAPPGLVIDAALAIPDLILGLIKLPFDLLIALVLPPNIGLILDLIALKFDAVFKLAFDIVVKLLAPLIPIVPKILIASVLIYVKNIVAMVIVDIVGMIVGAGGAITEAIAMATGLV